MLVVKIELWPFGSESLKEQLGEICIINDGTGTREKGNYKVRVCASEPNLTLLNYHLVVQ